MVQCTLLNLFSGANTESDEMSDLLSSSSMFMSEAQIRTLPLQYDFKYGSVP